MRLNEHGQHIGPPLDDWQPPSPPAHERLAGRYCRLEPLDPEAHAAGLYEAFAVDSDGRDWTYLPFGPFATVTELAAFVREWSQRPGCLYFAIVDSVRDTPVGIGCYLRIEPEHGCIEVGGIVFSNQLKRTTAATEGIFLLIDNAFDVGYRRCEWKCDSLNAPSRRAANRFGFTFEGIFRQAVVYKGRSRDTAWFAMVDRDWPRLRRAYVDWLAAGNFDADGRQKSRLSDLTVRALADVRGSRSAATR